MTNVMNEPIHIKPIDIEDAKYCIERLLKLKTDELTKDEKSKEIIDDCVRNVAQYLTSIIERQQRVNDIVESVYKEMTAHYNNNLSNIKETMSEQKKIDEKITAGMPSGPIYNMIMANKFDVMFTRETSEVGGYEFIPHWFSVADYYTDINSLSTNRFYLNAEVVKKTTYIGKPTKITNIFLNQEIIDFVNEFNKAKPEYFAIREYNNNDVPVIETHFYNPHITSFNPCQLSTDKDGFKSLQFVFSFDRMENFSLVK